jgi:hypothetical protein
VLAVVASTRPTNTTQGPCFALCALILRTVPRLFLRAPTSGRQVALGGDTNTMISLSEQALVRMNAFVDARLETPLFAVDIAGAFTPEMAASWLARQVDSARAGYRIIDAHLDDTLGALVVPAHPPFPNNSWGHALSILSDATLYRNAVAYYSGLQTS